jgi:hypothetical protein
MNTTPIVKSLIDEQLESIERSLGIIEVSTQIYGLLGMPRDFRVCDLPKKMAATQKGNRIAVRARP